MSKKLAIKGHPIRGNEIITLLEMLGGYADELLDNGTDEKYAYFIVKDENNAIDAFPIDKKDKFDFDARIFTLEEFLKKYPFKVGERVIDKADGCPGVVSEMKWDEDVSDMKYCVVFGNGIDFGWFANDSIEFCKNKNLDETKVESTGFMQVCKTAGIIFNDANYEDEVELQLGDYEIEVRDGKTYAIKKKPKYPTTYEECWKVRFEVDGETALEEFHNVSGYYSGPLGALQKLLCCRDAYWKIAGEEMGLDNFWEPDWKNIKQKKYCIYYDMNDIQKGSWYYHNSILAFPTKEMRSVFYKNFRDLIEECKELL